MSSSIKQQPDLIQIPSDSIRLIIHKLKQKGPQSLSPEQLALCLSTVGFQDVCKSLGAEWSQKNEKEALERLKKSNVEVYWLTKKSKGNQFGPFLTHCARGDIAKVKEFVRKASKEEKEEMVWAVNATKKTGLHIAVKEGYEVMVEYLLSEGWSPNARDRQLKSPLHYCCLTPHQSLTQTLLKSKSDPLSRDSKGCYPIHYAVCSTTSSHATSLLTLQPKLTDVKDSTGKTPLHYAVLSTTENQIDIMRLLLENGAKVNERDGEGRTALHYASQAGKSRCIPILMKNRASLTVKDFLKKTPLEVAANQRIVKLLQAYSGEKQVSKVEVEEEKEYQKEFQSKLAAGERKKIELMKDPAKSMLKQQPQQPPAPTPLKPIINNSLLGGDINQVSSWLRDKLFVLLRKLQQSGVRARMHIKRPYIFTGSWLQGLNTIQQLYSQLCSVQSPEAAMLVFNVLCPYEKKLPTGLGAVEVVEGFFGENWFWTGSVESIKRPKGEEKLRRQLEEKEKEGVELRQEVVRGQEEIARLEVELGDLNAELKEYRKLEDELRKERTNSSQKYSEILKLTNENQELRKQVADAYQGDDQVLKLNNKIDQLKSKNQQLKLQIQTLKSYQAAARRKCGKFFLKSLQNPQQRQLNLPSQNLYDDDSIIRLYELLESNPPNLSKRLQSCDRNGDNQLTLQQFTTFLQRLKMLPQDIMSMHRIVGFVSGRKVLPIDEFKQILENRPQLRSQWEKKLIERIKGKIEGSEVGSVERLFELVDADGSGEITADQLRRGLEEYNVYINQKDWSNLFSLLDVDKSGTVSLEEFRVMLGRGRGVKEVPKLSENEIGGSEKGEKKAEKKEKPKKSQVSIKNSENSKKEEGDGQEEVESKQEQQSEGKEVSERKQDEPGQQQDEQGKQKQGQQQQDIGNDDNHQGQQQPQNDNKSNQQQPQQHPNQQPNQDHQPQQQQQPQQNKQQQQPEQQNLPRLTGTCKVQLPSCIQLQQTQGLSKLYMKMELCGEEIVKVGDIKKPQWKIAVKFSLLNKSKAEAEFLKISIWKSKDFNEEDYIGEIQILFEDLIQKPNGWAVKDHLDVIHKGSQQQTIGKLHVQARWQPQPPPPSP